MNIALVILRAQAARGGAERYTIDLAHALVERGHAVTLVAQEFDADLPIAIRQVHLPASGISRTGSYRRFCKQVTHHIEANDYDIVHAMLPIPLCDFYHPHAGMAAEAVATGRHLLHRWANRLNTKRGAFASVERKLLAAANPPSVLCLSDYVRASVRNYYALDDAHLPTLFNAVNIHRFDPARELLAGDDLRRTLGLSTDRIVALMIAQDLHRKGAATAIDAVAQLNDPRLALVIVSREDPGTFAQQARQRGVSDQVLFTGPTPDPYPYYRMADLFVLPTRHDPCSLVVLEALAMGVPVISTRFNGATEIMTPGRHGHILPDADDAPALARAIADLSNVEQRNAASANCIQLRPSLSYEHHLDRLTGLYAAAIQRG